MKLLQGRQAHPRPVAGHRSRAPATRSSGSTCPTATPRRCRCASSSPTTEITRSRKLEGQWWGDGGAYFVASFARTSDGSVNEHDGQVWFYDPGHRDRHAQDDLRREPGPGRRRRQLRRPGQHHRLAVRRADPGRGRRGRAAPRRRDRARARPTRWPATTSTTASSPARRSARTARCCSPTSSRPGTCSRSPGPGAGPATSRADRGSATRTHRPPRRRGRRGGVGAVP